MQRQLAAADSAAVPPPIARDEWRGLALLAVGFACVYALCGLLRHWQFGSSAYDLGIFDQAIWHLSRFETPASSIRGVPNLFGDHFHPILLLLVPLYWIAPAPETLIVAQAVLFAASVIPVYVFLRTRLDASYALALAASYGLFWGLQRAAVFDFHEVAFAPLAIATAILAIDQRRWILVWLAALAIVLTKEDLIPLVTCFGLYLLLRGDRRQGIGMVLVSIASFITIVRFVLPSLSAGGSYGYIGVYGDVMRRPWTLPAVLVSPPTKMMTMLNWLAPFTLLPLASPLALLLVPFVLSRFLSDSPTHWGTSFHYTAPVAPILAMSAGDGLARRGRRVDDSTRRRMLVGFSGACVLLSLFLPGNQPLWKLFRPGQDGTTSLNKAGEPALSQVPRDASVVALAAIVPHMSHRDRIFMLEAEARDVEYVISADHLSPWPAASRDVVRGWIAEYRSRGYLSIFEEGGWIVLRRPK